MKLGITINCKRSEKEIHETLSRIGIPKLSDPNQKTLWPSCHLIEMDDGERRICHFKEAMLLEGSEANLEEDDLKRRNRIIMLLEKWSMIDIPESEDKKNIEDVLDHVFIIKHCDKPYWSIKPKYFPRKL